MKNAHRLALLAAIFVSAVPVLAQQSTSGPTQIYQQRTADGSIVLTDRPAANAQTERTWPLWHEDQAGARGRSDAVRQEAQAVSERVQRTMELQQQSADRLQLARLALAARRDAELAGDAALDAPVVIVPAGLRRGRVAHGRPIRPAWRPGLAARSASVL